uniref:Uncharacterized protein n=2 Tax=Cacopsylla melanoneura TaxID=428564 RepID=A0A8D8T8D0_9HEMI
MLASTASMLIAFIFHFFHFHRSSSSSSSSVYLLLSVLPLPFFSLSSQHSPHLFSSHDRTTAFFVLESSLSLLSRSMAGAPGGFTLPLTMPCPVLPPQANFLEKIPCPAFLQRYIKNN